MEETPTPLPPPGDAPPAPPPKSAVPQLADDVELLGKYDGSGFKEPRYLARRSDGDLVQLTELLYMVADEIDGARDYEAIAANVTERYGRKVSADNVKTLVEKKLGPDGFLAGHDGARLRRKKADPLLALKLKFTLVPARAVNFLSALAMPLFWPPVILIAMAALVALDIWYFGVHGIAQSLRDLIYQPLVVLLIYGLLIVSVLWHELGHAAACRYGGARPGRIGFGIYVVWPAFFTDVTDALTLGKAGRVRTDLGGLYFNILFSLAVGGVYFVTEFEPLLVLVVMQHLMMLYNLVPFLRLDGYHAISDITGIPDLFRRIKPTIKGIAPWKETPHAVTELKPWARAVVTLWVVSVVPLLLYLFGMMVLSAPRVLATGWDSLFLQRDKVVTAFDDGAIAAAGVAGIQAAMIVLPATGMFVSFGRVVKRIVSGVVETTAGHPVVRTSLAATGAAAVAVAGYVLIPNGEYKPIQPHEKWTLPEGLRAASGVAGGRPSLTEEYEKELGGAPPMRDSGREFDPSYDTGDDEQGTGGDSSGGEKEAPGGADATESPDTEAEPTPTAESTTEETPAGESPSP